MAALNSRSNVPLYVQLADRLLSSIRSGSVKVGEAIESENELSKKYGIGRPTVRQATESLIRRGYLERRRGSGTFVTRESDSVDLFSLGGTLASFSRQGLSLSTRLLSEARLLRECGAHPFSDREAFFVQRLASVDCEPVLLERLWFDAEIFPAFDKVVVQGASLSEAVERRYGLSAISAEQSFSAVFPDVADARTLEVEEGTPLLRVTRFLHFPMARNAVYAEMLCLSERYAFSQTIGGAISGIA